MTSRPFPWERSYPPGVKWDVDIVPMTIPQLLDRAVAEFGSRIAIRFSGQSLSFAELDERAHLFAVGLNHLGLGKDSSIALYLPNSLTHPVAFFGALKAGARVAHLSPLDGARVIAHKLIDSGARTIITTAALHEQVRCLKVDGLLDTIITDDDDPEFANIEQLLQNSAPSVALPTVSPSDIAVLQYTGGTTGLPKAAMLTHANLTAALSIYDAWFDGQQLAAPGTERVIGVLPLFHIYALTAVLLRHIKRGNEILLHPRFDADTVLDDIAIRRATTLPGVPTMWIALANHPRSITTDFSSLRICSSGGGPLPVNVGRRVEALIGQRLGGGWGMTELSPAGSNVPLIGTTKAGTVGLPLPGLEISVAALDDPRRELAAGETGEIRIKGPNVTSGYWNRPGAADPAVIKKVNASVFIDGWFLTGDVGYLDADGFMFLVDRRSDLIISGGFNVYPQLIEQAIYEHPAVDEAVVIGVPDAYRGEAAKAFVKLKSGARAITLEELRTFLADKLGRHELPTALELRAELPKTTVGKLSRLALRAERLD
jgi:long-chain acyl-CoA synthetase